MTQSKEKTLQQIAEFFGGPDTIMSQSAEKTALEIIALLGGNGVGWPESLEHELEEIRDLLPTWLATQIAAAIAAIIPPVSPYYPGLPDRLVHITPFDLESLGSAGPFGNDPTSAANGANLAQFYPFRIRTAVNIIRFWVQHDTVAGTFDIGIYDKNFARLVSIGSTSKAGASSIQSVSVSPYTLNPGAYYLAYTDSGGGAPVSYAPAASFLSVLGVTQARSAHPLPDSPTIETAGSNGQTPLLVVCGISGKAVI